jgi:hypothetical protein
MNMGLSGERDHVVFFAAGIHSFRSFPYNWSAAPGVKAVAKPAGQPPSHKGTH